jgi:hypothetical protein
VPFYWIFLKPFRQGEKMNNWHNEFMAEYHRQGILEEAEQIRLERVALKSRVYRPRLYARTMFNFANWMISTGKQLRKRYEVPAIDCSKKPTGSFAH